VADAVTYELDLDNAEKKRRVSVLLDAIQNLWGIGRQSRFLADISPKFVAGALLTVKNPIFLECVKVNEQGMVELPLLKATEEDFKAVIKDAVLGERKGFFPQDTNEVLPVGEAFERMKSWLEDVYK